MCLAWASRPLRVGNEAGTVVECPAEDTDRPLGAFLKSVLAKSNS